MKWSISEKFLAAFFPLLTFREKGNRRMGESSLAIAMFNLGELSRESNDSTYEEGFRSLSNIVEINIRCNFLCAKIKAC